MTNYSISDMRKNVLRKMPIWDAHDKFWFKVIEQKEKVNQVLATREKMLERVEQLLPTTPIEPYVKDVVLYYERTNNDYKLKEEVDESMKHVILLKEKLKAQEEVYVMDEVDKPWIPGKIVSACYRPTRDQKVILIKIKTSPEFGSRTFSVSKYGVARIQDHSDKLKVPKRVIAGLTRSKMFSGIIGQEPHSDNGNRYLVFMDDGSAIYYKPNQVYPILYQSPHPWQDSKYLGTNTEHAQLGYLRAYFAEYPKRNLIKIEPGNPIKLYRKDSLAFAEIVSIDCDTLRVVYKDNFEESIHRGSPRLIVASRDKMIQLAHVKNTQHFHKVLCIWMNHYHQASRSALDEVYSHILMKLYRNLDITGNRNTARKSTTKETKSRTKIRLEDPKVEEDLTKFELFDQSEIEENRNKHKCSPSCLRVLGLQTEAFYSDLKQSFRHVSDLKVPLLLFWKRKVYVKDHSTRGSRGTKKLLIVYVAPCGRMLEQPMMVRRYIINTKSKLDIDYFSFDVNIQLNNEIHTEAIYYLENCAVDKRTNQPLENKFISILNTQDKERLPEDFTYWHEVVPHAELKKKGFSFNNEYKSSCDCEDDCFTRSSCACHRLNEDFFGKPAYHKGETQKNCNYNNKRLVQQVDTGVFECNSGCKCSSKCANRVVQNGIRFRLQINKMPGKKGWGVQTLDDIPAGAFICTYAAELLDDADQYGNSDIYYADLDFITVNENNKLGCEEDEDEGIQEGADDDDDELNDNNKRKHKPSPNSDDDDFIEVVDSPESNDSASTSDSRDPFLPHENDNPVRYPKRKNAKPIPAQVLQNDDRFKYKRIHQILGTRDFTLDARMKGNVGRFFNHSCWPNAFVQNIFIETHDLRFPVVAFFAKTLIKASSEITWNYNYKTGTIPGRRIDCECGSANCQGRIL